MSTLTSGRLDHVGIAVRDIDASIVLWTALLGARPGLRQVVVGQGVEVAFLELPGATRIELVSPTAADSPVARFLEARGEGLHHVCVLVDDIDEAIRRLVEQGVDLVDERPRRGAAGSRIAFLHPRALGGVLLELKQPGPS